VRIFGEPSGGGFKILEGLAGEPKGKIKAACLGAVERGALFCRVFTDTYGGVGQK
jgi:hypothetical protein